MGYKIIVLDKAQIELDQALQHYQNISLEVLYNFNNQLQSAYKTLAHNPFFQIRYKDYRALPIKKFPYMLVYTADEHNKIVRIYSVFQTDQNPNKLPS